MHWEHIAPEKRAEIEARLPTGRTLEDIRVFTATAVIEPADATELELAEEVERAGGPPMMTDGKPTIMRVVAWLAHADVINRNRALFPAADLQAAATQIAAPHFLPMDFNHSAVDRWGMDQKAIGVWYKAEYKWDPKATAQDGSQGAHGILATGMMWSWMNPSIANKLLAEQQRHGKIDFSMACIAGAVTETKDAQDKPFEILHNPVFFTLSALDVPPADPDAIGLGEEGSTDAELETKLEQELLAAQLLTVLRRPEPHTTAALELDLQAAQLTEDSSVDELLTFLKEHADKVASQEAVTALQTKIELFVAEHAANKEAAQRVADLETALSAANASLTKSNETISALEATIAERDTALQTYTDAEAAKTAAEKLAARKAELDEAYLAAHEARTDKADVEARWQGMSDEAWTAFKSDIAIVPIKKASYLQRSREEGRLVGGGSNGAGASRLAQYTK